ncbi:peptide synthase [Lujinxingia litoralis]|uniref:Peptide synthase n=1 Tax=Lujinxingia litoralis TaxID=2211119 RepID=A0A328CA70_9DELT|nr:fatty acid CoA ligase family protein [Lujinxingia litoralis]RAL23828.1 peptide synthase [Lujinxingia litoralis]
MSVAPSTEEVGAASSDPNIARAITAMARAMPDAPAIHLPIARAPDGTWRYQTTSYAELDRASDEIAAGLHAIGIGAGTRSVLMVKPSMEFFALTFGLFKAGVVPVLVDPGMGIKNLKVCLAEAAPQAFIGIPSAHAARLVLGWGRGTVEHTVTVGRRWLWGGHTLEQVQELGARATGWQPPQVRADELAAILFTSGSTGVPKGAEYTHGNFQAQVELIKATYEIEPGEIDLPTFPLFALFDPALGMTTVLPEMDFSKPGEVDPRHLIEPIKQMGVTNMFGSPAVLNRLGRYGQEHGERLPGLQRVISAGAPVPAVTLGRVQAMLDEGAQIFTPYGATESLPVASIGSEMILGETAAATDQGQGVCVGLPVAGVEVEVIAISDKPIARWEDAQVLPAGEIGEFVVRGPQVTRAYFNREASTRDAKIADGDQVRHRMGDVGYFDAQGRMWFCGRKTHRVVLDDGSTMFTIPVEAIFNTHPKVFRTALVGVLRAGKRVPVLCVELESEHQGAVREDVRRELLALGQAHEKTQTIHEILFHGGFPVDVRHNSKIFREALTEWAQEQLR